MRQFPSSDEVWYTRNWDRRSELDWTANSPAVRALEHRPSGSTWYCGDRQKLRQVVSNFTQNSSMHGVRLVCSRDHKTPWWQLLFYRLLFGVSVTSMVVGVTVLIQQSFRAENVFVSSTNKQYDSGLEEDPYFPEFPRIVVCRRPAYKIGANSSDRRLLDYALLGLGPAFATATPMERSLMVSTRLYPKTHPGKEVPEALAKFAKYLDFQKGQYNSLKSESESFSLEKFVMENSLRCEDIFMHCVAFIFFFDCCAAFRPTLTPVGMCYSMELTGQQRDIFRGSKNIGFAFYIDLRAVPHIDKAVDLGYDVHLLDPRDQEIAFSMEGYGLVNGYATLLKTKLIKTSRLALHTPWHGQPLLFGNHCPILSAELDFEGLGDRFFKSSCTKRFMDKMMERLCGCRSIASKSNVNLRECDPEDIYGCFIDKCLTDNLTALDETCVHPCVEYNFNSEVNMVKLGSDNVSRLILVYDGIQFVLHEYRTTTISGFLSQIGGALGLYVGASIITAVELFGFLLSWCWYRFLPHRRKVHSLRRRTKGKDPFSYYC